METATAAAMARSLMSEHGIGHWNFRFDRAVRRFGCCDYARTTVQLSGPLTLINDQDEIRDAILHEIAHALAGRRAGHGPVWKQVCGRIGAKPRRCYRSANVTCPPGRYVANCKRCGHEYRRHRKLRRPSSCGKCARKFEPELALEYRQAADANLQMAPRRA